MRTKTGALSNRGSKLQQVDYLGNLIFILSIISLLIGLFNLPGRGGASSCHSPLVPWVESFSIFSKPSREIPAYLAANEISYSLPIYFQAVRGTTVLRSGICFLPFAVFAVIAGTVLSKFGQYRPIHATAFALSAIGFGILILDNRNTRWPRSLGSSSS
ncbi:hypothetical protein BGW36DRAFT_393291 [Talaromyces proteolyticus]|uniref:Uncharacterized protein n=1 Tax=Talaromyces proteolyticus TaxID=1131652 RepID=A0AAD4L4J4_9EURO|nr:uncharacterized protein BGW36DRAFT_393291 [Talaromyces proteolyticus]KAH8705773.1 hypothetical protein BGW36DRAFT_393291 [Talaromyces proteolyticus]